MNFANKMNINPTKISSGSINLMGFPSREIIYKKKLYSMITFTYCADVQFVNILQ